MTATGSAYADGPEVWRTHAGVEWSYWDLWFALLCVRDHGGDWDGLDAAITELRRFDGEAKWSHPLDLRQRLDMAGLSAGELLADAVREKGLITRARVKVLKRSMARRRRYRAWVARDSVLRCFAPRKRRSPQSLFLNLFGEASVGDADHAPADHSFVVGGQAFVVADAAAVAGDPG
ncbi:MAG TPA: hypothetical protein VFQ77_01090 [Pseudonocardiaceae bacterium]|nr:hypothetical protein [Pseudonocardiaceae bacterium]